MSMKAVALGLVLILWASWFFRYDVSDFHGITLDRWSGNVILPIQERRIDLSGALSAAEKRAGSDPYAELAAQHQKR